MGGVVWDNDRIGRREGKWASGRSSSCTSAQIFLEKESVGFSKRQTKAHRPLCSLSAQASSYKVNEICGVGGICYLQAGKMEQSNQSEGEQHANQTIKKRHRRTLPNLTACLSMLERPVDKCIRWALQRKKQFICQTQNLAPALHPLLGFVYFLVSSSKSSGFSSQILTRKKEGINPLTQVAEAAIVAARRWGTGTGFKTLIEGGALPQVSSLKANVDTLETSSFQTRQNHKLRFL